MEVKIVTFEETKTIGMRCTSTINNNTISALWKKFMGRMADIKNLTDKSVAFGVCPTDESECDEWNNDTPFDYVACMAVSCACEVPEGMEVLTIPGGKYAVFTHVGDVMNLNKTYEYIYGPWMTKGEYKIKKATMFEYYGEKFKHGSPDCETDIYIPIK